MFTFEIILKTGVITYIEGIGYFRKVHLFQCLPLLFTYIYLYWPCMAIIFNFDKIPIDYSLASRYIMLVEDISKLCSIMWTCILIL
jgi:hypothetical protein